MDERLKAYDEKMEKAVDFLVSDYAGIRAGRANPHVLDKIRVDYYGTPTPLQSVGNITVPEPRMIQIAPWEKSMIKEIEKAIMTSDLGINPNNDGSVIRLIFPELTEERRKELVKDIKKKGEDAKVAIRNIRRDGNDALKKLGKSSEVSEDEIKDLEDLMLCIHGDEKEFKTNRKKLHDLEREIDGLKVSNCKVKRLLLVEVLF